MYTNTQTQACILKITCYTNIHKQNTVKQASSPHTGRLMILEAVEGLYDKKQNLSQGKTTLEAH